MGLRERARRYLGYTDRPTEADLLAGLARSRETSEYEIFVDAARRWNLPPARPEADFSDYLTGGALPHYVRAEIRASGYRDRPHEDIRLMLDWAARLRRRK